MIKTEWFLVGLVLGGGLVHLWEPIIWPPAARVEVPGVGECRQPPQVARMQMLVDLMPVRIREQFDPVPVPHDQIAELIGGLK